MKKLLFGLSLLVVAALVLVGCTTGEAVRSTPSTCTGWGKYCSNLKENESKAYTVPGTTYNIKLTGLIYQAYAGGVHSATFKVNGQEVNLLEGEEQTLNNGHFISLTEVVNQEYAGGVRSASFCIR